MEVVDKDDLDAAPEHGDDILDSNIPEITEALADMSEEQLRDLLKRERDGKTRKGVIAAIEEALENLELSDLTAGMDNGEADDQ
jgi:hypothetical protein